jgi:ankyrin repeat protein
VNLVGRKNVTPLTLAAEMGHVNVCELLLRHGADVNGCGVKLLTPLGLDNADIGVYNTSAFAYRTNTSTGSSNFNRIQTYSGNFVLSTLIQPSDMDTVCDALLASMGALDPDNAAFADAHAPPHISPFDVSPRLRQAVPSSLSPGAGADDVYKDGSSPLLLAASNGHMLCCQMLLKYGADVNRMNKVPCFLYAISLLS